MIAPARARAGIAFMTGWLSVLAWLFTTASACIFCAQVCIQLASLFHPAFAGTSWQTYLIYVLIMCICAFVVIFLAKWVPAIQNMFFAASLLGFVVFTITVLATSPAKQSGHTVFVDWENQTGWGDGIVSMYSSCLMFRHLHSAPRHSSLELDKQCIHSSLSTALPTSLRKCPIHRRAFPRPCG